MKRLEFAIADIRAERYAVAPTLQLRLKIDNAAGDEIQAIALRVQIQIEPRRRHYDGDEEKRLGELFGTPERWGETLKSFFWTQASVMVPAFSNSTEIDVPLACTYDFEVATSKYFNALKDGEIPINALFSGSVFRHGPAGFSVEQVPWDTEFRYSMPASVWHEVMQLHFPNAAWIRVRKDVFDELYAFKARRGLPTWEDAFDALLDNVRETS